jgi:hypothetical protein
MRTTFVGIVALTLATGCVDLGSSKSNVESGSDDSDTSSADDSCKTEGSNVGTEGQILRFGSNTVTFHDWIQKTGEGGFVGFSITVTGATSLGYIVKTGEGEFHSTALSWEDPDGPDGKDKSPAISHVDFCENCTDGSCSDGGGGGGGGGGDGSGSGSDGGGSGSDGCIEGSCGGLS